MIKRRFAFILIIVLFAGCGGDSPTQGYQPDRSHKSYEYNAPPLLDDGWPVAHMEMVNLDQEKITTLIENILNQKYTGIESISIVKDGYLVLHEDFRKSLDYVDRWINNTDLNRHGMHSTTKSFVSTLIGIAWDQQHITNLHNAFYQAFSYQSYENWQQEKSALTLHHVLSMRTGMYWDEWSVPYGKPGNTLYDLMSTANDVTKAFLNLPMTEKPGTTYLYNTSASTALGGYLETKIDSSMQQFAQKYLFKPLNIMNAEWLLTPNGLPNGGSGLFLKTRDVAKLAQLYLNDGVWQGRQIISKAWIEKSLASYSELSMAYTTGYGYQWWIGNLTSEATQYKFYSTRGFGGQVSIIVPDLNLVVAFTGRNYNNDKYFYPFELTQTYIIPAILI